MSNIKEDKDKVRQIFCEGRCLGRVRRLKKSKSTFSYSYTNKTTKIVHDNMRYIYSSNGYGLPHKELLMQRKVKSHILNNIIKKELMFNDIPSKDISYYKYSDTILKMNVGDILNYNICAFDINKAYYTVAYNLGLLSERIYTECLGLDKSERLRLIGSIATVKHIRHYKDGILVRKEVKKTDVRLSNAWFNIVKTVDMAMKELVGYMGDDFLFYWFDGIYAKGNHSDYTKIIDFVSKNYGITFKNEYVNSMSLKRISENNQVYLNIEKVDGDNGVVKNKKFFIEFNIDNKYEVAN